MTADPDRSWRLGLGFAAAGLVALFVGLAFVSLLIVAGGLPDLSVLAADTSLRRVILFTLEQAALSTLLSIAGGVPLALALHRARFPGRDIALRIFLLPQGLPVLIGALAIIAVWGRGGIVSDGLAALGFARLDPYGLPGILIAHVFFNLPLATRILLAALDGVPAESWRLAGQLSLPPGAVFRSIEAPAMRSALPGAVSLVFMLCVTSFTLVLVLGGGPGATTLEVAIYQSLRYDFDPGRGAVLSLAQLVLTGLVLAATLRLAAGPVAGFTLGRRATRYDTPSRLGSVVTVIVVALGLAFILSPFVAIVLRGLSADLVGLVSQPGVRRAAATSLVIAMAAASLSLVLSLAILFGAQAAKSGSKPSRSARTLFDMTGSLVLVVPPIVLGAGWFLALRQVTDVFAAAPVMVVAANAVMAMPFVVRIVQPALADSAARHDRLAASLGLSGLSRLRLVEVPALRGPLGLGFAFALALSLGDLGVVALFGNQDLVTLPLLLLQRMGSYRTADAAGLALLLGVMSLILMITSERGFQAWEERR